MLNPHEVPPGPPPRRTQENQEWRDSALPTSGNYVGPQRAEDLPDTRFYKNRIPPPPGRSGSSADAIPTEDTSGRDPDSRVPTTPPLSVQEKPESPMSIPRPGSFGELGKSIILSRPTYDDENVACVSPLCTNFLSNSTPDAQTRCINCGIGPLCAVCRQHSDCVLCRIKETHRIPLGIDKDSAFDMVKTYMYVQGIDLRLFHLEKMSVKYWETDTASGARELLPWIFVPGSDLLRQNDFQSRACIKTLHGTIPELLPGIIQRKCLIPGERQDGLKAAGINNWMLQQKWVFTTVSPPQALLYTKKFCFQDFSQFFSQESLDADRELQSLFQNEDFAAMNILVMLEVSCHSEIKGKRKNRKDSPLRFTQPSSHNLSGV